MEVEWFTKGFDEVEMMYGMEDLMHSMHAHELVVGDYDTHLTIDEVNNISFRSYLVHYNFKKCFCNIVGITLCRCFLRDKFYLNRSVGLVMDLILLLLLLGLTQQMKSKGERHMSC